jgi:ATP synthase protein I
MKRSNPAFRLIGVGFYIGACIVGGIFLGMWLDNTFGTRPICLLAGLILGLVVAFVGVYRMLLPLIDNRREGKR